jgi:RNA recognition motif-containing protein
MPERPRPFDAPSASVRIGPAGVGVFLLGHVSRKKMGNRLYVGNLSFGSTQETLRDAFAAHGEVVDVHLVADRTTGQSRGFGFVTMGSREQAEAAMQNMNGADLDGRALKVNEAEERPGGGARRGGGGGGGGGRNHGW